jgi:hypothetical protein
VNGLSDSYNYLGPTPFVADRSNAASVLHHDPPSPNPYYIASSDPAEVDAKKMDQPAWRNTTSITSSGVVLKDVSAAFLDGTLIGGSGSGKVRVYFCHPR